MRLAGWHSDLLTHQTSTQSTHSSSEGCGPAHSAVLLPAGQPQPPSSQQAGAPGWCVCVQCRSSSSRRTPPPHPPAGETLRSIYFQPSSTLQHLVLAVAEMFLLVMYSAKRPSVQAGKPCGQSVAYRTAESSPPFQNYKCAHCHSHPAQASFEGLLLYFIGTSPTALHQCIQALLSAACNCEVPGLSPPPPTHSDTPPSLAVCAGSSCSTASMWESWQHCST